MSNALGSLWSNTDFPYSCLKDRRRTLAFREAIRQTVRRGSIVCDIGSGTGILAFFAAEAGAGEVYAVELDHVLAGALREGVEVNGLADRIRVIEGDASRVELPQPADVVIAELIGTGLLDEPRVPVVNALHARGVIGPGTRCIPQSYTTTFQLVEVDHRFHGFEIAAPKHEWPYHRGEGWTKTRIRPASEPFIVSTVNFSEPIDETVTGTATFAVDGVANGLRFSGVAELAPGLTLGATYAFNGDVILRLPEISGEVMLRFPYRMGCGLGSLDVTCSPPLEQAPA